MSNFLKNGKIIKVEKSHPDFKGLKFVIAGLEKSNAELRYHRKNILLDGSGFVGTDGRRLHLYEPFGRYSKGLYSVVTRNNAVIVIQRIATAKFAHSIYPKYRDTLPQIVDRTFKAQYNSRLDFSRLCFLLYNHMTKHYLDMDFLRDLPYGDLTVEVVDKEGASYMVVLTNHLCRTSQVVMAVMDHLI